MIQELPDFRQNLRRGALDTFEPLFLSVLKDQAEMLLGGHEGARCSSSHVAVLLRGLDLFHSEPGVTALMANLDQWKSSSKTTLMASELEEAIAECNQQPEAELDLTRIGKAFNDFQKGKTPPDFPSKALLEGLQVLVPRILRNFKLKVGRLWAGPGVS